MSIEKACLHETWNEAGYGKAFTKNENTIYFVLEVKLKQNFQYLSFCMTFQINLYSQILEKAKIPQFWFLDSFGKGLLISIDNDFWIESWLDVL